jgi:hypothetical protein
MSGALGYAMPYRRHIIIFFDRIETMQDAWTVLGHVMVHEITHIIQGVSRHSHTGLMKPHWSSRDLTEMRYKPLPFTQEDLILLYSGLAMRRIRQPWRDDPAVWLVSKGQSAAALGSRISYFQVKGAASPNACSEYLVTLDLMVG